jgi:hypothetical protein
MRDKLAITASRVRLEEQSGAYEANGVPEGAPAVAVRISGVSRRSVYRSAPVMEAREDLHWRRETPEIWTIGEPLARRGTH